MIITCSVLLNIRNVSDKSFGENKKNYDQFFFPWKPCHSLADVEKYCEARQGTVDKLVHIHCMLHISSYKHTLRIRRPILIAFPLQKWSHKFTLMLHLHIHCLLVIFLCFFKGHIPVKNGWNASSGKHTTVWETVPYKIYFHYSCLLKVHHSLLRV